MALVDKVDFRAVGVPNKLLMNAVKEIIWAAFYAFQDQKVTLKIWFFRKSFYIRDFYELIELFVGPNLNEE